MFGSSILMLALCAGSARAIPPFQRLFQAKYGYKPDCTACHDWDSWENTQYGKAFWKAGKNTGAFAKIESADHDEDGFSSGDEIRARANPGSPRSTPKKLGDWLEKISAVVPPKKHLAAIFPAADRFTYHEATVSPALRRRLEKSLDIKLRDQDLYPSYFKAFSGTQKLGVALYGASSAEEPCFFLAGYLPSSPGQPVRVAGVRIFRCNDKHLAKHDYLQQFAGKTAAELKDVVAPKPKLADASAALVSAVHLGAVMMK